MIQHRRADNVVPPETEVVRVIVVVVVARSKWWRQIEVVRVEEALLAAVIREEQFVLFREVLINSEAGLCGHYMVQCSGIEEVRLRSRYTDAVGSSGKISRG